MKRKKHPNMLAGDRHFGAKLAQPSRVFKDAVKQAVDKIAEGKSFEETIEEVMGKRAKRRVPPDR